jgi:hypothetical protein
VSGYDPEHAPDPESWLSLDESERMDLAQESQRDDEQLPSPRLHAAIHLVVENQVAMGDETPVAATLQRLLAEGLGRHDAVHAVGSVLSKHIYRAMKHDSRAELGVADPNESYYLELDELSAVEWRRSR